MDFTRGTSASLEKCEISANSQSINCPTISLRHTVHTLAAFKRRNHARRDERRPENCDESHLAFAFGATRKGCRTQGISYSRAFN